MGACGGRCPRPERVVPDKKGQEEMSSIIELIAELKARGIALVPNRNNALWIPRSKLTPALRKQVELRRASLSRWVSDADFRWEQANALLHCLRVRIRTIRGQDVVLVASHNDTPALRLALAILDFDN